MSDMWEVSFKESFLITENVYALEESVELHKQRLFSGSILCSQNERGNLPVYVIVTVMLSRGFYLFKAVLKIRNFKNLLYISMLVITMKFKAF